MPNYNKSFNFRNGLQIDDGNFIVNPTGLVGIGTTVPEKRLDVRGNAIISGESQFNLVNVVGVVTIGAGITLDSSSGIITATKFVGDASGLTNIVAISTSGFIANAGSLSTTAKVGIGTTTVPNQLDVLGNSVFDGDVSVTGVLTSSQGIVVSANGIDAVGIITASSLVIDDYIRHAGDLNTFIGFESNDIIRFNTNGSDKLSINDSGHLILLDDDDTYIHRSESDTIAIVSGGTERFSVSGAGITVTGDVSATGAVKGLSFSGNSGEPADFTNGLTATTGNFSNNLTIGIAGTVGFGTTAYFPDHSRAVFGDGNDLSIYHIGSDSIIENTTGQLALKSPQWGVQGTGSEGYMIYSVAGAQIQLYYAGVKKFETISAGASVYNELRVASLNGGANNLSTLYGSIRYGNENAGDAPYSTRTSLDIINYDTGNFNYYLSADDPSQSEGDFHWHKGLDNNKLMTLTNGGSLGIGETQPNHKLHVVGTSTVTNNAFFGQDVTISNNLTILGALNSDVTGNLSGDVTGNVNSSGLSTFTQLEVNDRTGVQFDGIGIGTTCSNLNRFQSQNANGDSSSKFIIDNEGNIAIGTDIIHDGVDINAHEQQATFGAIGIGTTQPTCAVDLKLAGQNATGDGVNRMYMLPPQVDTTQRNSLVGVVSGAIIYNTSLDKLQLYVGSGSYNVANWVSLN